MPIIIVFLLSCVGVPDTGPLLKTGGQDKVNILNGEAPIPSSWEYSWECKVFLHIYPEFLISVCFSSVPEAFLGVLLCMGRAHSLGLREYRGNTRFENLYAENIFIPLLLWISRLAWFRVPGWEELPLEIGSIASLSPCSLPVLHLSWRKACQCLISYRWPGFSPWKILGFSLDYGYFKLIDLCWYFFHLLFLVLWTVSAGTYVFQFGKIFLKSFKNNFLARYGGSRL